jgi:tetratricopeptide (TPR) repeat protein
MYSELLIISGERTEAVNTLKSIGRDNQLLDNPDDYPIMLKIAARLITLNEVASARMILERIREKHPDNADALAELAGLEIKNGNLKKAADLYDRALELDSGSAKIHCDRGILNLILFQKTRNQKYLEQALEKFNTAIEKDPYYAPAVNGRASVKLFSNRISEAIKDWKKTIEIQPDFINAYFNLAITFIRLNQRDEALKYLNILSEKYFNRLRKPQKDQLLRLIKDAKGI